MDIKAVLDTVKPVDNSIAKKINYKSAVIEIKNRINDISKEVPNRLNWLVRDTVLGNDYSGPVRTPKFTPEEQKELLKVMAIELQKLPETIDKAIKEYVGIFNDGKGDKKSSDETDGDEGSDETDDSGDSGDASADTTETAPTQEMNAVQPSVKLFNY